MTVHVELMCDDCGITADTTSLMPISDWEETDDGEDVCPACQARRPLRAGGSEEAG